ncbi:MAG: 50S ribosomal protein L35 [Spirochaetota bacterium]
MPKLKTRKGAQKRFHITKTGKIKRKRAYKSHILTKKNAKKIRQLRKPAYVTGVEKKIIKKMLPYG